MSSTFEHVDRSQSMAERLAQRLRQAIVEGKFAAGRQLPTEAQVSKTYGVSRATVREAMGRLKHDGLIITRQGAGAFVAEASDLTSFRLEMPDFADPESVRSVIDFLMVVEAAATALAAERRTPAQLEALRRHLDGMALALQQGDMGVEEDVAFHQTIVEASGNPLFRDFARFLDARVRAFIRTARSNTARLAPEVKHAVHFEHERIFDAVERQDAMAAKAAAEAHLRGAAERMQTYLSFGRRLPR